MPERFHIRRQPDDKIADVRISLGRKKKLGSYIVFRGDPQEAVDLLEVAVVVARNMLPAGNYTDERGRPQG